MLKCKRILTLDSCVTNTKHVHPNNNNNSKKTQQQQQYQGE